jgi:signal peptidase I
MTGPASTSSSRGRLRWRRFSSSAWFQLILAFVVFGLVLAFIAKPYAVPSGSMENTLRPGDDVLVYRLAFLGGGPRTGDVVVFDADSTWGAQPAGSPLETALRWIGEATGFGPTGTHTLVKRVIAGPGQKVGCCSTEGQVVVDGHPLDEPYVSDNPLFEAGSLDCTSTPRSTRCFGPVTVPKSSYLVLGDDRGNSSDSAFDCRGAPPGDTACFRWAKGDQVVGKVVAILWPFSRWRVV